jgi:hypothetical protein
MVVVVVVPVHPQYQDSFHAPELFHSAFQKTVVHQAQASSPVADLPQDADDVQSHVDANANAND